jgi:hypothetical protein
MSTTFFKLSLAAIGMAAILWSFQQLQADEACKGCFNGPDLPRIAPGALPSRRIR